MCGRYSLAPNLKQLEENLQGIDLPGQMQISFNIAPTNAAYVIASDQPRRLTAMEWGLVPHWSGDGKNSGKLINARAEGIDEKPSFREPVRSRHCLVVADSFYEWRKEPGGKKAPYRIFLKDERLLFMAGIWDVWRLGAQEKRTFSIITTHPNREMSALHNRMPVILPDAKTQHEWLSGLPFPQSLSLLAPLADDTLTMYRVSEKLNKTGYDAADLHDKAPEPLLLFV